MQEARKAFIVSESSEGIRRALRHNVRSCSGAKFFSGDNVYHKRNDRKRWRGPGKVLGQDGHQILIKHGSIYVRCHPCHVILKRDQTSAEENISESRVETSYKEKGKDYSSLNSNEHGDVFVDSESDEEVKSESHGNVLQEMNTTEDQPESENLENIPGTLPSSIESAQCTGTADNGSSANTVIKKNLTVKFKKF